MKLLEYEQKEHDLKAELVALATTITTEGRPLNAEERQRREQINADLESFADTLKFLHEQERESLTARAIGEDANMRADREGPKPNGAGPKVFPTLGHQMAAIYNVAVNNDMSDRQRLIAAAAGSSEAIDSDGGFLVESDKASSIEQLMHDTGTLLGLIPNPIEVAGNGLVEKAVDETSRARGSHWGAVRAYWVDEGDTITDSRPKFWQRETKLVKVAALGYSTEELLQDFPAMSSLFTAAFAEELLFEVEDAIFEGDGAGKPLGITAAGHCLITQAKETGQAADTFTNANISNMWNRFYARGRANGVWLITQEMEPQLDVMSIPAGTGALEPRFVTYGNDGVLRIKGRPVVVVEYASALGDAGDVVLADMTQYRLVRKGGVNQASSIHVRFATDEQTFRATYRIGGQPKWRTPLTPFKATSGRTVSPFVTLAAR